MPVRLFTIEFNEETQSFHDDLVQQFCVNKRVHRIDTKFFVRNGQPFWTVAILYGAVLSEDKPGAVGGPAGEEHTLDEQQKVLLLRLKEWRKEVAAEAGFPVYLIAKNAQLVAMIKLRCTTLESLKLVRGFGKSRIEKYGKAVTAMIQTFYQPS